MEELVLKCLKERRSVRAFRTEQVGEAELAAVLEAGTYAATGRNKQAPIIIAVQDKGAREKLRRMNAEILGTPDQDPFYGAPTILVVLSDPAVSTHVEDGALVLGNLMNAAHAVGLASCWIHRARQEFESEQGKALLKEWGIEGEYVGIGHLALGIAATELPAPTPRKKDYIYRV
ncbi:MAG: nitroreductase family protein [Ruminococcaceae bacterium]|nr:nitroreductase family protein [Oscillospiraceae bacterium]